MIYWGNSIWRAEGAINAVMWLLAFAMFPILATASAFEYTEIYVSVERPWDEPHSLSCESGNDDQWASNLGIAQHLWSPVESIDLLAQWTHHSCVISPGDDVSGESAETQAIVSAVHTKEIKDAYAAHLAEQQQEAV